MNAKELLTHVKYMHKVVKSNQTALPILEHILIKDGKLTVTNLETFITIDAGLDIADCLIDCKKLMKILPLMKGELKLEVDKETVSITDGKKSYMLNYRDKVEEFPVVPKTEAHQLTLTEKDLVNITKAMAFTSTDELRPSFMGILIDKKNIVATDAHKLFFPELSGINSTKFTLPKIIGELVKGFVGEAKVYAGKECYCLQNGAYSITMREIEANYPNWEAVVPNKKDFNVTASLSKRDLLNSIKSAQPCVNTTTKQIVLKTFKDKLVLSACDLDVGDAFTEDIKAKANGEMIIGFNSAFLKTVIDNSDNDQVKIDFIEPHTGVVINDDCLLMPVTIV